MDTRSGDSFTGPFSPSSASLGVDSAWERERFPSPKRSRSVRIAVGASDLPHTQGSVSRVDLASLARKLHVPVDTLSRSLGAAEHISSSLPREESGRAGSEVSATAAAPRPPTSRVSSSISFPPPVSPTRSARTGYGSASVDATFASPNYSRTAVVQFEGNHASQGTPNGSSFGNTRYSMGEMPQLPRPSPSMRVRYVQSPPTVIKVAKKPNREIGIMWEITGSRVVVQKVSPDSSAELAGVREGMRLVSVDGTNIVCSSDLVEAMNNSQPHESVELAFVTPAQRHTSSACDSDSFDHTVDEDVQSDGTETYSEAPTPSLTAGHHHQEEELDLEFEVHEDGHARVVKGRRGSAYLLNDHSGRPYFAVEHNPSPPLKSQEIPLPGQQVHGDAKRPSFFGSLVRQMSGVLGFSREEEREPLQPPPPEEKKHVLFADEGGRDLVSSVRHYEEIDTVVLELRFVFPRWVWFALAAALLAMCVPLPIMLKGHEGGVHIATLISSRALAELCTASLLLLPFLPSLRQENLGFLKVDRGWLVVVTAGMAYAATTAAAAVTLVDTAKCNDGERVCPPILFECLAPLILVGYYSVTRHYHRQRVGQAETPFFPSELLGMLMCVAGAGMLLSLQSAGISVESVLLGLSVSLGVAVDTLMRRRVASQLSVPLTLFLVHVVSAAVTLVGVALSRTLPSDGFSSFGTNVYQAIVPGVASAVSSLLLLLVLRHLHPYPVVSITALSAVMSAVLAKLVMNVSWNNAPSMAIPALLLTTVGTLLGTWANVHHRSVVEVEILQEKKLNRRKATGIKGSRKRRLRAAQMKPT